MNATITLPPVTPAFRDAVRTLGCQLGWKRVARMIAYGPVTVAHPACESESVARFNGNGHKRNGRKPFTVAWYEKGQIRFATFYANKDGSAFHHALTLVRENEATRYQRAIPYPFTPARPATVRALDATDARLALYPPRECCGTPMGIMESWGIMTAVEYQKTKNGYDETPVKAMYQCAVNAAHREEAYAMSGAVTERARKERKVRHGNTV